MKPFVGYMDLRIPDDDALWFVVNFLPFVRDLGPTWVQAGGVEGCDEDSDSKVYNWKCR